MKYFQFILKHHTGLQKEIPCFCSSGIAVSVRHVVGLQEPPRNTSHLFGHSKTQDIFLKYTTQKPQKIMLSFYLFIKQKTEDCGCHNVTAYCDKNFKILRSFKIKKSSLLLIFDRDVFLCCLGLWFCISLTKTQNSPKVMQSVAPFLLPHCLAH